MATIIAVSNAVHGANNPCEDGIFIPAPGQPQLYGVFDGHGGPEVKNTLIRRSMHHLQTALRQGLAGPAALSKVRCGSYSSVLSRVSHMFCG